ncbi:glycosyltransferase family 4 protein [Microcoleus sp. FACHB-68]|uniref:glycosyltransferase family 4 protein n=1 Tax=Microcoleus sp. FACHB-68 TaxID=2692826 RepID=UPI00168202B0|nr:glycosyltransferase family 4 protein [Microcoleus sp. FACHB-68]MBD1940415.1 glycosyltransferase family 4 protein [Microcoleus sp. FACHB-68]
MKPLLLSIYDISGGAARAAYRLHGGLQHIGVNSQMLVQAKQSEDETVIAPQTKMGMGFAMLRPTLDLLPLALYSKRERTPYFPQWLPDTITTKVSQLNPDVINLHWVCGGFVQIETLAKLGKPIVWTLHDMWPFTGGCHYTQECARYTDSCGACPQLGSHKDKDLSRWVWQRKAKAWKDLNLTIITPSHWLAKCAASSSLFENQRVEVIPNGLDSRQYKPIDRRLARERLNLPQDKLLILFGSLRATSEHRKGFHLLQPALKSLSKSGWHEKLELVVFGASQPTHPPDLGLKSHYLGRLSDDISLALVYAAADVFVAPSVQDNLPNTVMEALACGTPCVAFKIGGMPDMIEHQENGYLASPFEVEDFAKGIVWVLEDKERWLRLCQRAREKAEQEFTQQLQASRYLAVFAEIIAGRNESSFKASR